MVEVKMMDPPAVVLDDPKYPHNVGAVLRVCSCFQIPHLFWTGSRVSMDPAEGQRLPREERLKGYRDVQLHPNIVKPLDSLRGTPVAIELTPNAEPLTHFEHPADPIYIFGPEDGSVSKSLRSECHRFVFIPAAHCFNLSMAVGLVLYDRMLKMVQAGELDGWGVGDFLQEHRGWLDEPPTSKVQFV